MKKSSIKVGTAYADGKGSIRLVIAVGPEYKLYSGQGNSDCLRYRLIAKKLGPFSVGSEQNCTRISFASWAKKIVKVPK